MLKLFKDSVSRRKKWMWTICGLLAFSTVLLAVYEMRREYDADRAIQARIQNKLKPIIISEAIGDYGSKSKIHNNLERTLAISPDGKIVAYIYRNAEYKYPNKSASSPNILKDAVEMRWFPFDGSSTEQVTAMDSVDIGSVGLWSFNLGAALAFSPDSSRLAGLCSRFIVLADMSTGAIRKICYDNEFFGSLCWISPNEIAFTTFDKGNVRTLWRMIVAKEDLKRILVCKDPFSYYHYRNRPKNLPPSLNREQWSPDGRFILWSGCIFDIRTGNSHEIKYDILGERTGDFCWKPDGSAILVHDRRGKAVRLVNCSNGQATDLTKDFKDIFGEELQVSFLSNIWTPDERCVVACNGDSVNSGNAGYLIQLQPFKVMLREEKIIRWSPVPGWLLLQNNNDMDWIDYSGNRGGKIGGWPNYWVWGPNGLVAARIENGKVVVFSPKVPGAK